MAKKNKLWFSGEDAQLAARFTKCLTKALYNRRASYLRAKAEQAASEISIEECSEEVDKMYIPRTRPVECINRREFAICTDFFRHFAGDFLPPCRDSLPPRQFS